MEVTYRKAFLRDLKKLKGTPAFDKIYDVSFNKLVDAEKLADLANVKAMQGYANRYRIRVGNYRIGIEVNSGEVEVVRVVHRRDFYRYFP